MEHKNYYVQNEEYAKFLNEQDDSFFDKYYEYLTQSPQASTILDIGCGTGQVVHRLEKAGFNPKGIEVSQANLDIASNFTSNCQFYNGTSIPFDDDHFDVVGSFNVLEHVENPEGFIKEMVRVTKPGGNIVLSSPNFLRVLGFMDYHPHMRSLGAKLRNARTLVRKFLKISSSKQSISFDRMSPIVKDNFEPDDDAIIATNLLEMSHHLKINGCKILSAHCTDRKVHPVLDWILNASPLKYVMFNAFLSAQKMNA